MSEILLLGIVVLGLLTILGLVKSRTIFDILFVIILCGMLFPFAASLEIFGIDGISWLFLIFSIIFGLLLIKGIIALIFGREVAGPAMGNLIANLILAPFRIVIEILRGLFFRRNI